MREQNKVALTLIARDKADIITNLLDSTNKAFDVYTLQDTGSTDNTIEVFTKWCKKNNKECYTREGFLEGDDRIKKDSKVYKKIIVNGQPTLGDFASARNDSFELIPDDIKWGFWADTDDKTLSIERLPKLVELCNEKKIDQVVMEYVYAKSPDGMKPVTHSRERLINLEKKGAWKNRVHEGYQFGEQALTLLPDQNPIPIIVEHQRTAFEALATGRRNHLIMQAQLDEEGIDNFPDDVLHHYAFDLWEHRELEESIKYYEILINRFNDKPANIEFLGGITLKLAQGNYGLKKLDDATKWAFENIRLTPKIADGYLVLAQCFADIGNWEEARHYSDTVIKIGKPNTTAPINEYDYLIVPLRIKMQSFLGQGNIGEAFEISKKLVELLPGNPDIKKEFWNLRKELKKVQYIEAIGKVCLYLQESNNTDTFMMVKQVLPLEMLENDMLREKLKELRHDNKLKTTKYKFAPDYHKSIIFFAGQGYEQWDGESDTTKGIGGSEGMCIQMARELARLGNSVTVFNDCGYKDGKVFDGVTYVDFIQWTGEEKSDIFISLRRPDVFSRLIKAKKQFLWLHDTEYGDVPLVNMYAPNKVIVLTGYHKDIIKLNHGVEDDNQFWVTRNALNKKAVEYVDSLGEIKRNPYQIIWGSSYDRGLDNALAIFRKVKERIPEATFKIFYGTVTLDKMIQMRAQMGDMQTAQAMQNMKSKIFNDINATDGAMELGRVSQNELYKNFAESAIWLYPTQFTEISCITAMTSQAMGAVPVCTAVGALAETVNSKYGIKTDLDKIADAVIYLLENQEELERRREPMIKWARDEFSIDKLAQEWNTTFNEL